MAKRSTPLNDDTDLRPTQPELVPPPAGADVAGYERHDETGRGRFLIGVPALVSQEAWDQLSAKQKTLAAEIYRPCDAAEWAALTTPPAPVDETPAPAEQVPQTEEAS